MNIGDLIIGILIGLGTGFSAGLLYFRSGKKKRDDETATDALEEQNRKLDKEVGILSDRLEKAKQTYHEQKEELKFRENTIIELKSAVTKGEEQSKFLKEKLDTQKKELEELQKKFTTEFENLASKILKQNTREFSENNEKRLGEILNPLKEKIQNFEKKVNDVYDKEAKDRHSLKGEIERLHKLNLQINEEAKNLTKALKGDTKTQGNWGELILEKILESSGLIRGEEYETQYHTTNPEGKRIHPDVVVYLPDDKHIIIDSKVSLNAYEAYTSEEDDETKRQKHLKNHLISIRNHIKGLSEKNYQQGSGMDSPDFVLLFMPIEAAFSLAVQQERDLYAYAWDRKVVIVSPSTLLATLKTIASVWKHERQTKNAIDIADKAGKMYDKFAGFVNDMEKIKRGIDQSSNAYADAMNKLKEGKGNLIGRAEKIKELGAKTNKNLPENLKSDPEEDGSTKEIEKE